MDDLYDDDDDASLFYHSAAKHTHGPSHHPPSAFAPRYNAPVHVRQPSEPFFDNGLPVTADSNDVHDSTDGIGIKWNAPQHQHQQQQMRQRPAHRTSNSGTTTRSSSSLGWMPIVRGLGHIHAI